MICTLQISSNFMKVQFRSIAIILHRYFETLQDVFIYVTAYSCALWQKNLFSYITWNIVETFCQYWYDISERTIQHFPISSYNNNIYRKFQNNIYNSCWINIEAISALSVNEYWKILIDEKKRNIFQYQLNICSRVLIYLTTILGTWDVRS